MKRKSKASADGDLAEPKPVVTPKKKRGASKKHSTNKNMNKNVAKVVA